MASQSETTTDHETIKGWVEQHGGSPATIEGTGSSGNAGVLRIDFPGGTEDGRLDHITWDEWFEKFDREKLAFLYQERQSSGEDSTFCKVISQ